jgi:lysophospholipase L1-like esterase
LGLSPFLILETVLRVIGYGASAAPEDPFVGFTGTQPLFVPDAAGQQMMIAPQRQTFFYPEQFPREKPADEFRIFCLGGSTVAGRPFAPDTSFTRWLEISLNTADSERSYRVVNCGGISYASYRLVPILKEILQYDPDLVVLMTGHNEFLESRTYAIPKKFSFLEPGYTHFLAHTRTGQLALEIGKAFSSKQIDPPNRPLLEEEVSALLDQNGGLDEYQYDPAWQANVNHHFAFNLQRMANLCREAGVPSIWISPCYRLAECPPFKSGHTPGLDGSQIERIEQQLKQAQNFLYERPMAAADQLEQVVRIDPENAQAWYLLGIARQELSELNEAKEAFLQAKEKDLCPLRIQEEMRQVFRHIAEDEEIPFLDFQQFLEDRQKDSITDGRWLLDHVHPTIAGHQKLADLVMQIMADHHWVHPLQGYEALRDLRYNDHIRSLNPTYFVKGQMRLKNLRMWSRGEQPTDTESPGGEEIQDLPEAQTGGTNAVQQEPDDSRSPLRFNDEFPSF